MEEATSGFDAVVFGLGVVCVSNEELGKVGGVGVIFTHCWYSFVVAVVDLFNKRDCDKPGSMRYGQ